MFETCEALEAWKRGELSYAEAMSYFTKYLDEVLARQMIEEAISGEARLRAAEVIK